MLALAVAMAAVAIGKLGEQRRHDCSTLLIGSDRLGVRFRWNPEP
jgi:hypothetical protein